VERNPPTRSSVDVVRETAPKMSAAERKGAGKRMKTRGRKRLRPRRRVAYARRLPSASSGSTHQGVASVLQSESASRAACRRRIQPAVPASPAAAATSPIVDQVARLCPLIGLEGASSVHP
jgi:hypothetical protein